MELSASGRQQIIRAGFLMLKQEGAAGRGTWRGSAGPKCCLLHAVPDEAEPWRLPPAPRCASRRQFPPLFWRTHAPRVCDSLRGAEERHKMKLEKLQTQLAPGSPVTQALGAQGTFRGPPSASLPFPFLPHPSWEWGSSERGPRMLRGASKIKPCWEKQNFSPFEAICHSMRVQMML